MWRWRVCPDSLCALALLFLWSAPHPARGATQPDHSFSSTASFSHVPSAGVTSSPSSTPAAPLCRYLEVLNGTRGFIEWVEKNETQCNEPRSWLLLVDPGHGAVVHMQKMYMRTNSSLRLSSYHESSGGFQTDHIWKNIDYRSQITVVKGGLVLEVTTPQEKSSPLSMFTLKYSVYPLTALPQKVDQNSGDDWFVYSSAFTLFNCSTGMPVPEAMACDGVRHCVDDEDENQCDYRKKGCRDWFPYHDQCLKIEVLVQGTDMPGLPYATDPTEADRRCRDVYGATLLVLSPKEGPGLVTKMMHQSGAKSIPLNLRKVQPTSKKHRHLYRFQWQWGTKGSVIAYEQKDLQEKGLLLDCAVMVSVPDIKIVPIRCFLPDITPSGFVCMKPNPALMKNATKKTTSVHLTEATRQVHQVSTKRCADGSVVQMFHQCHWQGQELSTQWSPNHFPLFQCQYGPPVHYTVVCDGLQDCADGSDEAGCLFPHLLSKNDKVFICDNRQVIDEKKRCDGVADCFDESDEELCTSCQQTQCKGIGCVPALYAYFLDSCSYVPVIQLVGPTPAGFPVVHMDGYGMSELRPVEELKLEGYFNCSHGLHIPTFLLNNGEKDCLNGEDEGIALDSFTCPGFYRCQHYGNCVHSDFVCDGIAHCPNKDDERYCNLTPPSGCRCEGYACSCQSLPLPASDFWYLRYLDLSTVPKPAVGQLFVMEFLQFLNLSFCQLENVTLTNMPQLNILDLSYNALSGLSSMLIKNVVGLKHLNISGNPMVTKLDASFSSFLIQAGLNHIQHLVMRDVEIKEIVDYSLSGLTGLKSLDIRNNRIENYQENVFRGLDSLTLLQTDDFRMCCSYFHGKTIECLAPASELSSCADLLRSDFFRLFLWVVSLLTILGNSGIFTFNVITCKKKPVTPFRFLVSNLCVADFLMGVYMMIIGAADSYFRNDFVASERRWRLGGACTVAGVLGFVSCEVSTLMISLITLDRLLMLCFPLKLHLHFSVKSCARLCCSAWTLGILLAAVPFMGQFEFYGESSICLPLPITRHQFSGQTYAFVVFIVLNFLLFLFIGTGQLAIYWAVHRARAAVKNPRQEEQTSIARRLFLVVFTDFCCWFPVGLMGILASAGVPIPGVVSVWAAVFVLPLNSALNPFLYTLNSLKEKWRAKKFNDKCKRMLGNLKGEIHSFSASSMEELMMIYLRSNRDAKLSKVFEVLRCKQDSENSTLSTSPGSSAH